MSKNQADVDAQRIREKIARLRKRIAIAEEHALSPYPILKGILDLLGDEL